MKKLLLFLVCLVFFTLTSANADAEETYYGDKVWTISFNMEVDRNTINEDNIFIKNASGQTLKNIELTLDPTNTQVYVDALDDYLPGQYTLHISDQVKSARGDYLKTSTTKTFTIESYGPITILEKSQLNDAQLKLLDNWEVYFQEEHMSRNNWEEALKNSRGAYYLGDDLYIVTTGVKPTGGYNIRINKIETGVDQTVVYVEDIAPKPGAGVTDAIDYPFIIIKSTVPPNATLSFLIDKHSVPIKDVPLSNPIIDYTDKALTIIFDMELDATTVNKDNIFIKNASGQTLKNIKLTLDTTNTQVYVEALDDYLPKQYTLHISDQVKSKSGNHLKTSIIENSPIKSYGPITILEESQLNDAEKGLLENWEVYFQREYMNMNMNSWAEAQKISKGAYYLGENLYIVTTGLKPSGGYKIRVNKIETDVNQTVVYVEDIAPKPGTPVPTIIDYPFIIIKSTAPPNETLSFLIDEHSVPIKDISLSNPIIHHMDKTLTITFSTELDATTVNKDNIFIKNASGQTLENIELTLDTTNTQVYVEALDDYLPGQYTLHISDQVKVKNGRGNYLKTPITKTFTIESYGPITILEKSQLNDAQLKLLDNWEVYFQEEHMNGNNWGEALKNSRGAYYLGDDLYIVTTGLKPHGGYNIRINNIDTDVNQTVVYVEDVQPSSDPNIAYPAIIDYPFIIIKSDVPPNTLSFLIDGDVVPLKDFPLANQ